MMAQQTAQRESGYNMNVPRNNAGKDITPSFQNTAVPGHSSKDVGPMTFEPNGMSSRD